MRMTKPQNITAAWMAIPMRSETMLAVVETRPWDDR